MHILISGLPSAPAPHSVGVGAKLDGIIVSLHLPELEHKDGLDPYFRWSPSLLDLC